MEKKSELIFDTLIPGLSDKLNQLESDDESFPVQDEIAALEQRYREGFLERLAPWTRVGGWRPRELLLFNNFYVCGYGA